MTDNVREIFAAQIALSKKLCQNDPDTLFYFCEREGHPLEVMKLELVNDNGKKMQRLPKHLTFTGRYSEPGTLPYLKMTAVKGAN